MNVWLPSLYLDTILGISQNATTNPLSKPSSASKTQVAREFSRLIQHFNVGNIAILISHNGKPQNSNLPVGAHVVVHFIQPQFW